jgi:hypothetical protein
VAIEFALALVRFFLISQEYAQCVANVTASMVGAPHELAEFERVQGARD